MEAMVRTIYGANLQSCQLMKTAFSAVANSTLNEKFQISQSVALAASDMPGMRYVVIGNGGHRMKVVGGAQVNVPEPIPHRATDAALFAHLPFVLRPISADLTAVQRERYALRKLETHGGESYFAYYMRRMDLSGVNVQMEYKAVTAGSTVTTPFAPDASNLNPAPPTLSPSGTIQTSGDYVTATAKISFILDSFDIQEIVNACEIKYGSPDYAIISEIGLCSGLDKLVTVTDGASNNIQFNEVIASQIVSHISSFHALRFTGTGINTLFDVGATEPLFLPI